MVAAVQLGLLAACIVLFVPMGLAGWHLSRNKMLFFSGALFITLAVGVHLTPYFPSITTFLSSLSTPLVIDNPSSCISFLHEVNWVVKEPNLSKFDHSWGWSKSTPVLACGFQKLDRSDACDLLNGLWVVVVGDSQARLVVLSLLNLVLDSNEMELIRGDLFKRHSDYGAVIEKIGVKLDFVWAPYTSNITDFLKEMKPKGRYPDVMVMGSGLWHMLHVTDSFDYGNSLGLVRKSLMALLPVSKGRSGSFAMRSPHMFWLGMPTLVNSMLNTQEKRNKMNDTIQHGYEREVYQSKLLTLSGGPLVLLDIKSLSQNCGARCTIDGMHYGDTVYEAAVQIMLNSLIIESHQRF